MLVRDAMTPDPICGHPGMPVTEVQALMREHDIRHVPVVDEEEALIGLITQRSLLNALRTEESDLSQFEVSYILARIKVHHVMVRDVITIDEDVPIEEAARVMADRHIGCLPVMRGGELIGIITDNDLFNIMVNLLGARRPGVRMAVLQPDRPGEVARLTTAIAKEGGNLTVCVGYPADAPDFWISLLKVTDVSREGLVKLVDHLEEVEVHNVQEM